MTGEPGVEPVPGRETAARLPTRMRLLGRLIAVQLALLLLFRAAFYFAFRGSAEEVDTGELLSALWVGAKFDLRLVLLLTAPLLVLGALPFLDPHRRRHARPVWLRLYGALGTLIAVLYAVDFGHYDYLHQRMDAALFDQVLSFQMALQMVWETYPVIPAVLGLAAFALAWTWVLRRLAFAEIDRPGGPPGRVRRRILWGAAILLWACGIYGKLSWYPLRWSDAFVHETPFATALALNPVLFLLDSFPDREVPYDGEVVRESYESIARLLEVDRTDPEALDFGRSVVPAAREQRRNVFVIHLESMAGFQTGVLGSGMNPSDELDPSPHFDALCEEGILFSHFFIPRGPTARSVWALVTGIPDLNPVRSASRNPRIVAQHTLIEALEGYEKYYFLGGSATWANIRGLLAHNIEGLHIYEEGDYGSARGDVWGISDLAMFEEALKVLDEVESPFFCFLQTSGNHRPYTIPEDRRGFELEEADGATLLANGFPSLEAYNGFRFLDHSLGWFFEAVKERGLYENSIFLMYADHGVPAPHGIPWERLALSVFHVPFLIIAPGWIEGGRRVDTVGSLVDLMPTALSLLGVPHYNQGLGRDLLVERPADRHFAFVEHGLLTDDYFLRADPAGRTRLYRYHGGKEVTDVSAGHPDALEELGSRYFALREWCGYMLYHNPPRSHPDGDPRAP